MNPRESGGRREGIRDGCRSLRPNEERRGHEPIVAIDLGEFKSVARWHEPETLKATLQRINPDYEVFEAQALIGRLADLGLAFVVANTMHEAWSRPRKVRRETIALQVAMFLSTRCTTSKNLPEIGPLNRNLTT